MSDRSLTSVVDRAAELAAEFAKGAAERDRTRSLPREEVEQLSAAGVLAVTVPESFGGLGGGAVAAAEITRLLATTDPSIAQIPHSHFVYLRLVELAGGDELKTSVFADVLAGKRIANAQSERGGKTITDIQTTVGFHGGHAVVNGRKYYATGSLLASRIAILARADDGSDHIAFTPVDTVGLDIVDDWSGFGQRTTASGTITLTDVQVPRTHVAPRAEALTGPHAYGPFAQVLHAAIDAGIARGALADARRYIREKARPWAEAGVDAAATEPLLIQRFGEHELAVRAAEAALRVAAEAVDAAFAARTPQAHAEASLAVAAARALADQAAIGATNAVFELGGASATDLKYGLDRNWRNARTHTAHDPVRWKIHHLGRWSLNGTVPPRHGQI